MLKLDIKTVQSFEKSGVEKIKIFFYDAGCAGQKLDIQTDDFPITDELTQLTDLEYPFAVYVYSTDVSKLEKVTITRVVVADHSGEKKTRYIVASSEVQQRCGCGSSFSFEKWQPKIQYNNLKDLKTRFQK